MVRIPKLLSSARENPSGLSFAELKRLVESSGFELDRINGSHHVYKKKGVTEIVNIQPKDGKAKAYQVRQIVDLIDKYSLIKS